jgi:hypothetical protein
MNYLTQENPCIIEAEYEIIEESSVETPQEKKPNVASQCFFGFLFGFIGLPSIVYLIGAMN